MDALFAPHNSHLSDPRRFRQTDPHLSMLAELPHKYSSPLLSSLPCDTPGIYSLTGGRQIGKTTLLKQWMDHLLCSGVPPTQIAYFTGEVIDDHHSLIRILADHLSSLNSRSTTYIVLDEITYIRDWDKGVKFLSDAGQLIGTCMVLTGSDCVIIRDARARFPGRRGEADTVDFHMFPISFNEYVQLTNRDLHGQIPSTDEAHQATIRNIAPRLLEAFETYLLCGGYLRAINDIGRYDEIRTATFATYTDWIRGDMLKRGKQEHYLREVLGAMVRRLGTQVTWNSLARDLSIDHPATVSDYVQLLARMDAAFIQPALREDRLAGAPKKARKLMPADPFIFHAIRSWLSPHSDPFNDLCVPSREDPEVMGRLAEMCAATHYSRYYPTYYIKSEGEVDIACVRNSRFWPLEVKWTSQIRPKDLKQLRKYPNGKVLTRTVQTGTPTNPPSEFLPLHLFRLGPSPTVALP